jgi:aminoglycoside/choline kinase family phosphotransferase
MYRLSGGGKTVVGVVNKIPPENEAFIYFARHFRATGLPVPEIYLYRPKQCLYLEEDLGDTTLLDFLKAERPATTQHLPTGVLDTYRRVLDFLPRFQVEAANTIDFSKCFPNPDFSSHALKADMHAFSRELVARLLPEHDISALESDYSSLISFLGEAKSSYFLYRDFQSRNVMLVGGQPYFIDFQGGRRGPLQYDVVSLLCQASAGIPESDRAVLVEHYLSRLAQYIPVRKDDFYRFYNGFVVSRMLQVLGVYGRQGLGGGKEYFTQNIPPALKMLYAELSAASFPLELPALSACARALSTLLDKELQT